MIQNYVQVHHDTSLNINADTNLHLISVRVIRHIL